MLKMIIVLIGVIVLLLAAVIVFLMRGPDLSRFEYLKNPQTRIIDNQTMIVVDAKGDPNVVGGKAFGLLFRTYFKIKGVPKGPNMPAPRARWPLKPEMQGIEWRGLYAIPVPHGTTVLPTVKLEPGLAVRLDDWEYGKVAEILHIGPYNREEQDIARLTAFIKDEGYSIVGDHEEEYLKGPGMFFKGNSEKYYTIIRYRVQKAQ